LHIITFAEAFDFIFHDQSQVTRKTKELRGPDLAVEKEPEVEQKTVFRDDFAVLPTLSEVQDPQEKTPAPAEADRTVFDDNLATPPDIPQQPSAPKESGPMDRTVIDDDLTPAAGIPEVTPKDVAEPPGDPTDEIPTKPKVQAKLTYGELVVDKISKSFNLKGGENIVGRTIECDIFIDDPSVSRTHAVLECSEAGITLKDLGSKNHTFIGGAQVGTTVTLAAGSRIRFGDVDAVLNIPEP
jgi:hypothetical protein